MVTRARGASTTRVVGAREGGSSARTREGGVALASVRETSRGAGILRDARRASRRGKWTFGVGISPRSVRTPRSRTRAGKTRLARGSTGDTRARARANNLGVRRREATRYRRRRRTARRRRVARARPRSDSSFFLRNQKSGDARRRGRARRRTFARTGRGRTRAAVSCAARRSGTEPRAVGSIDARRCSTTRKGMAPRLAFRAHFERKSERVYAVWRDPAKGRGGSRTRNSGVTRLASENISAPLFRGIWIRNGQLSRSALPLGHLRSNASRLATERRVSRRRPPPQPA